MSQSENFEHYQLLKNEDGSHVELGHGAMGVTYKAFDTNLRCQVALKVISAAYLNDPTAEERFLREARAAARLRHRNVASVFHLGRHGDSYFYAMEFIEGETVDARVKREGAFDLPAALDLASQVANALTAAAKQNLIHRDIKPSNLMLVREDDGELLVKVIDFGLVKSAVLSSTAGALTSSGFVGTPYFASPEQLDQQTEDIRSDIYSLGVTLWFMLTGRPTFMGSVASVIAQHLEKVPSFESLAVLPACVVGVLRKMLEKDTAKRFQAPSEVRAELKHCIEILRNSQSSAGAPLPPDTGENFETVALSSTHGLNQTPRAGAMLGERYRLIEDLNTANPNHTFHAEDVTLKRRVRLKIVRGNEASFARVEQDAARLKQAATASFIEVLDAMRVGSVGFVALEWLEGFSLVDLLRVRRELTVREVLILLDQIATATDAARELGVLLELQLRDVFIHFPEGLGQSEPDVILRCPLAEWPIFVVKLNPLGCIPEVEAAAGEGANRTIISAPQRDPAAAIVQVGKLSYDLLGGTPGRFTPLANLSECGNEVLRRCLTRQETFATAREFFLELSRCVRVEAPKPRLPPPAGMPPLEKKREFAPGAEGGLREPPAHPGAAARGTATHRAPVVAGGIGIAALLVIGVFWLISGGESQRPAVAPGTPGGAPSTAASPAPAPAIPVSRIKPPKKGAEWKNSLEMIFVPLDENHFCATKTRVRDFKAFVDAEHYDAIGGMASHQKDGFKDHGDNSWEKPGFAQSPDDPVVGVSWTDAKYFCEWLTRKERGEGSLRVDQIYRLPKDREWSEAAGLGYEWGATPEERSGKIKGVYPWGPVWPPPADCRNYAGAESKEGNPRDWPVIPNFRDRFPRTSPATEYGQNVRKIYDLGGNVWEWCHDEYNKSSRWRVLRGGSWATSKADEMLSSYRLNLDPSFRQDDAGFRCVIAAEEGNR